MSEKIIYLNGAFVAESEAKVSVLDSGFNAGDGVYDVTRTFAHRPLSPARSYGAAVPLAALHADEMERATPRSSSNATGDPGQSVIV